MSYIKRTQVLEAFKKALFASKRFSIGTIIVGTGFTATCLLSGLLTVHATELLLKPPKLPWSHNGIFSTFDHSSIRRGYEVYKGVCAACHTLNFIKFRNLVGVCLTEEEAKADASEHLHPGEPDEEGNETTRTGKLYDSFPNPYKNEQTARAANEGALPQDLSYIVLARKGDCDYIFHLLTGYMDPPAGEEVGEGLNYNIYFPGQKIAMPQQLFEGGIEYQDGTPATISQMAKDVTVFLRWAAEPEFDERKRIGFKALFVALVLTAILYYYKRHKFSVLKSRKLAYAPATRTKYSFAQYSEKIPHLK